MLIFHSFLNVTAWRLYSVPYANPPWSKAECGHSWKTSGGHTLAGRRCNICQEALGNLTKLHWRIKTWGPFLHKWNFSNCLETDQVNRTGSFFQDFGKQWHSSDWPKTCALTSSPISKICSLLLRVLVSPRLSRGMSGFEQRLLQIGD